MFKGLKNSAHNLSIFVGDPFLHYDRNLTALINSWKQKKSYVFIRTIHMYADYFPPGFFFLTLVCVLEVFQLGLLDVILYYVNYVLQRPETFSCEQYFQSVVQMTVHRDIFL